MITGNESLDGKVVKSRFYRGKPSLLKRNEQRDFMPIQLRKE